MLEEMTLCKYSGRPHWVGGLSVPAVPCARRWPDLPGCSLHLHKLCEADCTWYLSSALILSAAVQMCRWVAWQCCQQPMPCVAKHLTGILWHSMECNCCDGVTVFVSPQRSLIAVLQGKNFQRTFTSSRCPIPQRFPASFSRAMELQKQHDPNYIFEPELFTKIRTNQPYELYPGCAGFDKSCYCEEDIHCANDYVCVYAKTPGLESYKVCKPDWSKDPQHHKSLVWPKKYPEKGLDVAAKP